MSDETNPAQAQKEREATSEGRAEIGPLAGLGGAAASEAQRAGRTPGDAPDASAGSTDKSGGGTVGEATGSENGNTATPPNR